MKYVSRILSTYIIMIILSCIELSVVSHTNCLQTAAHNASQVIRCHGNLRGKTLRMSFSYCCQHVILTVAKLSIVVEICMLTEIVIHT